MEENSSIRAFICISLSDSVIKEVARLQELLGNKMFAGRMTELENLHLTLKFLGEVDESIIQKVKEKLKTVKFQEFEAKMGFVGTFSKNGMPKIVWVKINGKDVRALQEKIDDSLKGIFKKEERFMSHMTIARIKYVNNKVGFMEYVKKLKVKDIKFKIDCFKFMKSDLRRIGAVYTILEEYPSNI